MRGITKLSVLSLSLVVLSGCWLDDDDNDQTTVTPPPEPEVQSTYVRVHHTSADAPNVNVLADGSAVLEGVPYHASSNVLELDEGTYSITLSRGFYLTALLPTLSDRLIWNFPEKRVTRYLPWVRSQMNHWNR